MQPDKEICREVITYLETRRNQEDVLDQIVLGIFDSLYENLQQAIIKNLGYLKSKGVLLETQHDIKNITYKLTGDKSRIQQILQES